MRRVFILSLTIFCLAKAHAATIVMHCTATDKDSQVASLDIELNELDRLEAILEVKGAAEKTRYGVEVWENPTGYLGQYLELNVDEWDHVTTPASLAVQYPHPTDVSTFTPNLNARLACEWK